MQHETCKVAIDALLASETTANVHRNKDECQCPHKPTPCDWAGNEVHYACLQGDFQHPQKVYTSLNSGGFGKIIVDTQKTP